MAAGKQTIIFPPGPRELVDTASLGLLVFSHVCFVHIDFLHYILWFSTIH